MKSITFSRIFSCVINSLGLEVGDEVGLVELVGLGEEGVGVGVVDVVDVGVGLEGRGDVEGGRGEEEGVNDGVKEGVGVSSGEDGKDILIT